MENRWLNVRAIVQALLLRTPENQHGKSGKLNGHICCRKRPYVKNQWYQEKRKTYMQLSTISVMRIATVEPL